MPVVRIVSRIFIAKETLDSFGPTSIDSELSLGLSSVASKDCRYLTKERVSLKSGVLRLRTGLFVLPINSKYTQHIGNTGTVARALRPLGLRRATEAARFW
jgi:hypothetical protein